MHFYNFFKEAPTLVVVSTPDRLYSDGRILLTFYNGQGVDTAMTKSLSGVMFDFFMNFVQRGFN